MRKEIWSNFPYLIWLAFYYVLFSLMFGANGTSFIVVAVIYAVSILTALSPAAEGIYRWASKVRPMAHSKEIDRLLPLFEEVYDEALEIDPRLPKDINLYVQEDMDINAFAFGRSTLVLTRGSIEMLSDESLKGLMAHEFGHFSHLDTTVILIAYVGNMSLSIFTKFFFWFVGTMNKIMPSEERAFMIRCLQKTLVFLFKTILFIGDLILMPVSRSHEYMADAFADKCGFGNQLAYVLYQIYKISKSGKGSVIEQLRSTHPPLSQRIGRLERD